MKQKVLFKIALAAIMLVCTMQAHAGVNISGSTIDVYGSASGTVSSDMTCTMFQVFNGSTLTINQGVTVTLNNPGYNFGFFDNSKIELHGTLTGSAGSGAMWMDMSYINVYLSDGAKYTVTGLSCMDGNNYLVYYGYDAATDGNGTVSVKNGSTDVTSTSTGYKTTTYTFTATPASGYKFVNWTKGAGGEVLGTDASINVTCEQNGQYQVYANFEADAPATTLYNLTLADGSDAHGTVAFTVDGAAAMQAKKDDVVTVSVTPNEGYSTKDVTVRAYTTWDAAPARGANRAPSLLDDIAVTPGETAGTWTFTMPEANVWVVVSYTKNLQDAWIEAIADQTYTGEAIEPTVTVKDGETSLTLGTDYTVEYANNVETGTATVTVTGMGGYSGTATATFIIRADKTALNGAITEAEAYYESIKDSNPDAAEALKGAIDAAKAVQGNADATQAEADAAITTLGEAVTAAKADVALKRITLTIPAKSYMARIDADKRQIETAVAGVSLYSVKSVTDSEVELTAELSVIAAEMPYFIYNDNDEEVTVSIVVSSEDADDVLYDSEHFKGTLVDKTFTDEDMQAADHYVLSGQNFVWVKDAGTLAAGKCWIELVPASAAHARALSIVREGETTGISTVKTAADTKDAVIYDLQGRRVMQPTKGLFIVNGKKVVVK